ncbi:phosphoribosyltransferase [Candidatus Bathyarchaeota archaeon]|nr:phosphoribosyltransferase [Candidatus Bathyarchaeota archaeon]
MVIKSLEEKRFIHLNHNDIENLVDKLYNLIIKDGYKPDLIIAISRGGFEPARILCDKLSIKKLTSIQVESYKKIDQPSEPVVIFPINSDLLGHKVLLVDDVSDTGKSILKAKEHIKGKNPEEIKTATLHLKPKSSYIPDYYVLQVDDWIIYPWEIKETIKEISSELNNIGNNTETIVSKLLNMGFTKKAVKKYFLKN